MDDLDFDAMAAEWARSAKKRASDAGEAVTTGTAPAVPQYRMTPDGSAILEGWNLDWGGAQGKASTPVRLRHAATGRVIVDGVPFGQIAQQSIQDPVSMAVVWIPNASYQGGESPPGAQPVPGVPMRTGALSGMGEKPGVARRIFGVGVALLGLGVVGWTGWRVWSAWSGDGSDDEGELEPVEQLEGEEA